MTKYICKCGRVVAKNTTADNTGNRDTAGCEGCPYLLPWGPMVWDDQQKGCTQDVKGYECRMSPTLEYVSTYHGRADDKCSLHIVSLDLDFLDEVQAWIYDNAANTLSAGFSRGSMRGTDFCNRGRYSLSVTCAQNKAGMAAKAALLARFFGPGGHRLDMTPQQEKAHILAAIEAGKARAQKKEDKALTYKDPITGWLYRVSPKPDEKSCFFIEYLDPNSSVVWKRDHKAAQGHPRIDSVRRRLAYLANEKRWEPVENVPSENPTDAAEDAQPCAPIASDVPPSQSQSVDADAQPDASDDLPETCRGCQCAICGNENCASPCWENPKEVDDCKITGPAGDNCKDYRPKEDTRCQKAPAQKMAAAATTETSVATTECPDISTLTNVKKSAAPASPADAGAATQSLSAAEPASLEAESAQLAFDYSGLDDQTVADLHLAEREYSSGKKMAEMGLRRMADAVAIAHDALCGGCDNLSQAHNNQYSKDTFGAWCESIGIHRKAAERLLQVSKLMDNSSPREQKVLEELSPSLLYAAAKPSAPAKLVQAVKDGDITTHKQYQEAMAQLKAEREAREESDRRHQAELESNSAMLAEEQRRRQEANEARIAAEKDALRYKEMKDAALETVKQQREKTHAAERRASAAEAEVARQKRIGLEMQEEVETRNERIRELQQSQTVVAGAADPEEIERRAQEIAQAKIAESDAKWSEIAENQGRQLAELRARSSGAVAVKSAHSSIEAILNQLFHELHRDYDDACLAAMEDMNDYLFATWQDIHDLLHPEDVEDVPDFDDDDEEDGYDDET